MTLFTETQYGEIKHCFGEFQVANIDYIIDFSADCDVTANHYELDNRIEKILKNHSTYTIKFGVKDYYESEEDNVDLYAPPKNHQFKRKEIQQLKEQLETLLYKHYLVYQPECYFFIGIRPSLVRMYQKMCDNRHPLMLEFETISGLGHDADCFIIKTPNYHQEEK